MLIEWKTLEWPRILVMKFMCRLEDGGKTGPNQYSKSDGEDSSDPVQLGPY